MSAAARRRGGAGGPPGRALTPPPTPVPRSCKQNQDLLSFYAVVMGLDNAAVSRLRLTWEVMTRLPLALPPPVLAPLGDLGLPGSPQGGLPRLRRVGRNLCAGRKEAPSSGRSCPRARSLANGPCLSPCKIGKKPESPRAGAGSPGQVADLDPGFQPALSEVPRAWRMPKQRLEFPKIICSPGLLQAPQTAPRADSISPPTSLPAPCKTARPFSPLTPGDQPELP